MTVQGGGAVVKLLQLVLLAALAVGIAIYSLPVWEFLRVPSVPAPNWSSADSITLFVSAVAKRDMAVQILTDYGSVIDKSGSSPTQNVTLLVTHKIDVDSPPPEQPPSY